MNEIKKARPAGGTAGQATTETAASVAAISGNYFTTEGKGRQLPKLQISDVLPRERESALKMRDLKELFSKDSRTIRLMIQRERRRVPILSDNMSGYWVSNSEEEIRQFTGSMRRRARQIWTTAANVERAAGLSRHETQLIDGQIGLFGGGADG